MNLNAKMLEVQPNELRFVFELKKQSTCSILLNNITNHHVAFKVKTTSPRKYCVRPNVGVIMPKSNCEISVIMQAQKVAPTDMLCKDKFLIQSTIVPVGITDNDIKAEMFAKDNGNDIEETKLKVALISPHQSPELSAINEVLNQGPPETQISKDPVFSKVEILTPPNVEVDQEFSMKMDELKPKIEVEDKKFNIDEYEVLEGKNIEVDEKNFSVHEYEILKPKNIKSDDQELNVATEDALKPKKTDIYNQEFNLAKVVELKPKKAQVDDAVSNSVTDAELISSIDLFQSEELVKDKDYKSEKDFVNERLLSSLKDEEAETVGDEQFMKDKGEIKLVNDMKEMKSKLNLLESKLSKAESTISKLIEECKVGLRNRGDLRPVRKGFPLLFVVMVALLCMLLGYILRR